MQIVNASLTISYNENKIQLFCAKLKYLIIMKLFYVKNHHSELK